ncbi:GRB2-associated-binding protein 4 isoform X1 [Homo sapiens]|uniref:GRB2-associated-binding protein 4 isoform X1 n=2 Tax=Homo sapiens TaxID=9606 RepID=UPI0007DC542A|nr:GRB2-associated-binding protein 4 isoform X1 [Homo sapiens]|eukprot:XP_016884064.1 GRB2-associated-binding protein 4 isoform X1 [Homo sapiens]
MSLPSPSPSRELCPPDPAFAPLSSWPGSGPAGGSTRSGHVLYSGWLRKSPPEKKLRLFAWRKRWFILRRGQTSSDPDVLEYYKNDGSKKPLRTINLNLCEQLDVDVTLNFNKKEIQKGYMFDIKTSERTFYLVAETREDMNEWVQSICQICGFRQEESTGFLGNISSASHGLCSSPAEPSCSHQHLPQEQEPTSEPPVSHCVPPTWPIPAPPGCLRSHQHASQRAEHARSASFSQGSEAPFIMRRNTAMQNLAQHSGYSVDGVSGHIHGFHSLSKPSQHNAEFRGSTHRIPWSLASHGHTRGSLTGSEADNEASSGKYTQHGGGNASRPAESMHEGVCSFLPGRTLVGLSDSIASEGSCVPMNPGSPTLPAVKQAGDDSQGVCIPVGSCLVRFDLLGSPLTELSMHQDLSQGHEVQLPPVNRSLKPNQKANPTPPNLRNNRVINELSFKPPVTEPWSGTSHTFDSSSSQHPISTQSITNTDSEDSGERYLFPQNPASAFPVSGGTSSSAPPRSTGNIHYAALDFQPSKPSIGSVTSGKKVDYVQVDLEKTQALQKTMHEQMCLRQSSEPPRGAKL